jgi:hypothetical protein
MKAFSIGRLLMALASTGFRVVGTIPTWQMLPLSGFISRLVVACLPLIPLGFLGLIVIDHARPVGSDLEAYREHGWYALVAISICLCALFGPHSARATGVGSLVYLFCIYALAQAGCPSAPAAIVEAAVAASVICLISLAPALAHKESLA